jgi:hypothetical protein
MLRTSVTLHRTTPSALRVSGVLYPTPGKTRIGRTIRKSTGHNGTSSVAGTASTVWTSLLFLVTPESTAAGDPSQAAGHQATPSVRMVRGRCSRWKQK